LFFFPCSTVLTLFFFFFFFLGRLNSSGQGVSYSWGFMFIFFAARRLVLSQPPCFPRFLQGPGVLPVTVIRCLPASPWRAAPPHSRHLAIFPLAKGCTILFFFFFLRKSSVWPHQTPTFFAFPPELLSPILVPTLLRPWKPFVFQFLNTPPLLAALSPQQFQPPRYLPTALATARCLQRQSSLLSCQATLG